jgi:hypothetical protein
VQRLLGGLVAAVAAVVLAAGCGGGGGGDGDGADDPALDAENTTTTAPPLPTAAELCDGAEPVPGPTATVAQPALVEASGVAESRENDGLIWAHNDSGGNPELFALGMDGSDRGRWAVPGATAQDWEDMARGPGEQGVDRLYMADIGDNNAQRANVVVYRGTEPEVPAGAAGGTVEDVEALTLTYADGPRDAETLLSDPVSGDLFVVSKQLVGRTGAYRIPAGAEPGGTLTMARVADVGVDPATLVTGGDVSLDGSVVALRTYTGVLLFQRADDETVSDALAGTPCQAPAPTEVQGEALAFDPDGRGYVTISEGANPAINHFRLP